LARGGVDPQTDESQRSAPQPKVKDGGKDDIDAIGNREIGGRGLGNWYSLETNEKPDAKPSLQRAPKTSDDSNTEDDPPTLKRRDNRSD
jgi:hypothetical protein